MDQLHEKYERLKDCLRGLGGVAVAFSGGVDSTFLLKAAREALGDRVLAITAQSCFFPRRERDEASEFCAREGIRHEICVCDELSVPGIRENPRNRCYLCKRSLFEKMTALAASLGFDCVAEGSNMDDLGDYRPGLQAVAELGVASPLREAELYKAEIRALSKELGLSTWDKPSFACLASRFVYGEPITEERLNMVERAEQLLLDLGLSQMRVRVHGDVARIEALPEQFPLIMQNRARLAAEFKKIGFSYAALDLQGYRTGSMNETLAAE
ncbi:MULTISPECIES: ATP-dependent sacrificial sulfur transferase LarE [unclassified Pyramidobacter]|uniref:ATP-dependent sacrificial sulfur transferase LarE n=1 Tax=unclassified Pyramidobacter TaxID=2632171 RepID=UPI000EA110A0|nr:ATP-dependent sacrificial sulfur transferase LarE [Pyramidobacter sp. CG50-2]RKJ81316.1 ATP-dependent sacrificial sulfur transferase LarE [Pyramidobacter sp. CG50-2]